MKASYTPAQALNQAYRKEPIAAEDFERFCQSLDYYRQQLSEDTDEEHQKTLLSRFLREAFYLDDCYINTKGNIDLCIHHGDSAKSPVGVLLETKQLNSRAMPRSGKLNTKAVQQLLYYYLQEREANNLRVKHLVATDMQRFMLFDELQFDRLFYQNKQLLRQFREFEREGKGTGHFYEHIAAPAIAELEERLSFTWLDLEDYFPALAQTLASDIAKPPRKLIQLYKVFSPTHLLKRPFANDSNSLNKGFYLELLHLLGLEEDNSSNKKIIRRKAAAQRDSGSLLENTLMQLQRRSLVSLDEKLKSYPGNREQRLEQLALELCITWMNRILFLKLLEGQLLQYGQAAINTDGNSPYLREKFLQIDFLPDYDALDTLFFDALAQPPEERPDYLPPHFQRIPYLNSSLFELTRVEENSVSMGNLNDRATLRYYSGTVLRDAQGKRRSGETTTLRYLFDFLDAYNFASEGSEEIQRERKSLINASVLGLIFEKINGYRDGSFYTPSFITMYMSQQSLRRAVLQKCNAHYSIDCADFADLQNFFSGKYKTEELQEANALINGLRICDPAVGSGHFLVSALNELLAIKSDLGILVDAKGQRLPVRLRVENDELFVLERQDESFFQYRPGHSESQRVQQSLFHEKQNLIEQCLFGVDINPNSVKICRLRLWIELLKQAYYREERNYSQLETLPNIDINIKTGNSLISRFDLDTDVREALKKSKWTVESYRNTVQAYRNAPSKPVKRELRSLIDSIKKDFRTEISRNDPKMRRKKRLQDQLLKLQTEMGLFEESKKQAQARKKKEKKWRKQLKKVEQDISNIRNNQIYQQAFEWRFEFPEVLDEAGDFRGFDVVIGNPPYISTKEIAESDKAYYRDKYESATGQFDLYLLFVEKGIQLLRDNGLFSMITSNTFLSNKSCGAFRNMLVENVRLLEIVDLGETVFKDAKLDTAILSWVKESKTDKYDILVCGDRESFDEGDFSLLPISFIELQQNKEFKINLDSFSINLIEKLYEDSLALDQLFNITRGVEFGSNYEKITEFPNGSEDMKVLVGGDISKYQIDGISGYLEFDGSNSKFKDRSLYEGERILIQRIRNLSLSERIVATFTEAEYLTMNTLRILHLKDSEHAKKYGVKPLLGIINSTLINYFFRLSFQNKDIYAYQLSQIPIPTDIPNSVAERLEELVDQLLVQKREDAASDTSALEAEIDRLVYGLYGLTEAEIGIVEEE